jgi:hypothetical protein
MDTMLINVWQGVFPSDPSGVFPSDPSGSVCLIVSFFSYPLSAQPADAKRTLSHTTKRYPIRYPNVQELRQQHASLYACLQDTWSTDALNSTLQALVSSSPGLDSVCLSVLTGQREESLPKHRLIRFLRDAKALTGGGGGVGVLRRRPLYIRTDAPGMVCRLAGSEFGSVEMCFTAGNPSHEHAFREIPCHVQVTIPGALFSQESSQHSGFSFVEGNATAIGGGVNGGAVYGRTKDGLRPEHLRPIKNVCVSVTIGDDGDMPNEQALPYGKVLRLLRRARKIVAENPSEVTFNSMLSRNDDCLCLCRVRGTTSRG